MTPRVWRHGCCGLRLPSLVTPSPHSVVPTRLYSQSWSENALVVKTSFNATAHNDSRPTLGPLGRLLWHRLRPTHYKHGDIHAQYSHPPAQCAHSGKIPLPHPRDPALSRCERHVNPSRNRFVIGQIGCLYYRVCWQTFIHASDHCASISAMMMMGAFLGVIPSIPTYKHRCR